MPRSDAQWQEIREATRGQIVRSAMDVFKKEGFHGASIDRIARNAGVSKGLAYHYFRSKEELFAAVIENWIKLLERQWISVETIADPRRKLRRLIDVFCESVAGDPDLYRLYFSVFTRLDFFAAVTHGRNRSAALRARVERIRTASRALFSDLGFDDPAAEVAFFSLLTSGLAAEMLMRPNRYPLAAMKRRIWGYYEIVPRQRR